VHKIFATVKRKYSVSWVEKHFKTKSAKRFLNVLLLLYEIASFALDVQQLECEWKPQNCETDAQEYWAIWLLTVFLHSPIAYVFQLGY